MKHLDLTDDNNKDGMNRIWGRAHALGTSEERVTLDARLADGGGVLFLKLYLEQCSSHPRTH